MAGTENGNEAAVGPSVGDVAPGFQLPASHNRTAFSVALAGKPYLVYFYPKADTSGCTVQACGIQEALPALSGLGLTVIGVSPDPVPQLDRFAAKYGLEFLLASDAEHTLADAYGCWVQKSMYGRTYWGMERSSFLVDADGRVAAVWRKVKPAEHAAQVKQAAEALARRP
ncbi:thioredoxin-dependent thiol peroxidase [Rhizosaccharibacter radicis]|uniref:thioredoxin-dependent peroxiredoxin n=1 Tax=Rhizosaccharibacter radicis TaxID=2782605 RepID=A0ABT1VXM7_9PROT|nr:thioredoxin-dependent thiol peroxidase [Acetobacteraceae bacterium KSS12]